ncbi:hypothetical protein EI94DRAFT_1700551 [Lactarius quietus]|nr:hypothetical protein EI94DRAFT_1700551 [Lactarius quietus]
MWFLQHEDGTTLTRADVRELRMQSKAIWQTICDTHGHIGVPWSKVPRFFQLTFYKELERNCSFFCLCKNHYKADAVAHADYSHWYYLRYPPLIEDEDVVMSKRTCTSPACPRRKSKWRKSKASQSKENDHDDEESSVDELDDDTDAILCSVEDDTNRQRNTCQRLQRRPRLQSSPSSSSDHDVATGSAVKTPPVTSLTGNEDAHAASEINERDEQMADVSQTQATVASLAKDDDTQIAPETKKREELIVDNVHSMNIDADNVQPPGEEVNDSDMHVQSATG